MTRPLSIGQIGNGSSLVIGETLTLALQISNAAP